MIGNSCCYWRVSQEGWIWNARVLVSVFLAMGWNAAVPISGAESGFTKQGPRRGGRADAMNGDALDAEGRLRMVISFPVAAAYRSLWQPSYQCSTHKGIAGQQEPVLIHLRPFLDVFLLLARFKLNSQLRSAG